MFRCAEGVGFSKTVARVQNRSEHALDGGWSKAKERYWRFCDDVVRRGPGG